ncbi:hypothetical protein CULT_2450004 [[Clostridium] ultunense Esp]|nr:hypothetical protein CULT_2450004 [[Clostridium] ultunense Esp]
MSQTAFSGLGEVSPHTISALTLVQRFVDFEVQFAASVPLFGFEVVRWLGSSWRIIS